MYPNGSQLIKPQNIGKNSVLTRKFCFFTAFWQVKTVKDCIKSNKMNQILESREEKLLLKQGLLANFTTLIKTICSNS